MVMPNFHLPIGLTIVVPAPASPGQRIYVYSLTLVKSATTSTFMSSGGIQKTVNTFQAQENKAQEDTPIFIGEPGQNISITAAVAIAVFSLNITYEVD